MESQVTKEACKGIKASIKESWQRRSETYDALSIPGLEDEASAYRSTYKKALASVFNNSKLKILDVGTGTGFLAFLLAEMGHELTALDLTEGMLEKARTNAAKAGISLRFQLGDAENLPFGDGTFDAVVCRHVLWTLPKPANALKEWIRVTKHGGQIVAIEGKWRDASAIGRLRELTRRLGILLHRRLSPGRFIYGKEVKRSLPFHDGLTIDMAIDLFRQVGLGNIWAYPLQEVKDIQRKNQPLLCKATSSYTMFLVSGRPADGWK